VAMKQVQSCATIDGKYRDYCIITCTDDDTDENILRFVENTLHEKHKGKLKVRDF
jgi:hypothetical protein